MDSILPKRPCSTSNPPLSNSRVLKPRMELDDLLVSILNLNVSNASLPSSLDLSIDRLVQSSLSLSSSSLSDSSQNIDTIDALLKFSSLLQDSANRSARKRASLHNSFAWALPPELTVKVFSALDTQSLCHVAATCSMFNKCAMDPLCYANIDLTFVVPKVNNMVVTTMIQRAREKLQSLKLGILPAPPVSVGGSRPMSYSINIPVDTPVFSWNDKRSRQGKESCGLTRSCLVILNMSGCAAGSLLKRLHLYNIDRMDSMALCTALSSCQSLVDLELVGLHVELKQTLESVSSHCHLLERLFFESSKSGKDDSLKSPTCSDLVDGCPSLSSLALRGIKLQDHKIRVFLKGLRKLKFVDFSTSYSITGSFLRSLGSNNCAYGQLLEVLILRDCAQLKEVEVARFLSAVASGDCKLLRFLDISNKEGLAFERDWYYRCYNLSLPVSKVLEERPEICLLAEFPSEESFVEIEHLTDGEVNSDGSLHLQLTSETSLGSSFANSSENSYTSDQASGNEDGHDAHFAVYGESSDEAEFLGM